MARAFMNWYVDGLQQRFYGRKIARRQIRDANNPFEIPDTEFVKTFRISKQMAIYVIDELTCIMQPKTRTGLPVHVQVLTCVRILAVGCYQRGAGNDHLLAVAPRTVSKYLTKFTGAVIQRLMPQWIRFPGTHEHRLKIANGFFIKHGLPDILGCVDCTQVAIFTPSENAVQYLCHKGFHSLNVQIVSDVDCQIVSVLARYPGRAHDNYIFNNSNLKLELERLYRNRIGNYYLLGDSGYALTPWLMTPILGAVEGSTEDRYTKAHCQIRNCVERLIGYVKGTFRCMRRDRVLHYHPEKASEIIYACCTLYNIMLHYRIPMDHEESEEAAVTVGQVFDAANNQLLNIARARRQQIINSFF